jgi:hypothetical protein
VARVDLDAVRQLEHSPQRVEHPFGTFASLDGEVRTSSVADEERVSREQQPWLVGPRPVDHGETGVLGTVARRVQAAQDDVADLDLVAVGQRVMRVLRVGRSMDGDRDVVLEPEPSVPRDVVGMRVSLQHAHDADTAAVCLREILVDLERRIDDDRPGRLFVADEIRRAAEIVVDELREDHAATVAAVPTISLEVSEASGAALGSFGGTHRGDDSGPPAEPEEKTRGHRRDDAHRGEGHAADAAVAGVAGVAGDSGRHCQLDRPVHRAAVGEPLPNLERRRARLSGRGETDDHAGVGQWRDMPAGPRRSAAVDAAAPERGRLCGDDLHAGRGRKLQLRHRNAALVWQDEYEPRFGALRRERALEERVRARARRQHEREHGKAGDERAHRGHPAGSVLQAGVCQIYHPIYGMSLPSLCMPP